MRVTLWDMISGFCALSPLVASLGVAKGQHTGVAGWLIAVFIGGAMAIATVALVRTVVSRAIDRLVTGKPPTTAAEIGVALLYLVSLLLGFAAMVASSLLTYRALGA